MRNRQSQPTTSVVNKQAESNTCLISTDEFLEAFRKDAADLNLRFFYAKGDPRADKNGDAPFRYGHKVYTSRKELRNDDSEIDTLNLDEELGVYFVVNSGGDEDIDITHYKACFVENDDLSIAEQHKALDDSPLPPSIRVETKKSVHAYWLLRAGATEEDWRDVQCRLIYYFNGDPANKNPSRVMRLPGYEHITYNKSDGSITRKLVEVVEFEPKQRYGIDKLLEAFEPVPASEKKPAKKPAAEKRTDAPKLTLDDIKPKPQTELDKWKAEAGIRIANEIGTRNSDGKYDYRAFCHASTGNTGAFYNPALNYHVCNAGCSDKKLFTAIAGIFDLPLPEIAFGDDESQAQNQQQRVTKNKVVDEALSSGMELFTDIAGTISYATVPLVTGGWATLPIRTNQFRKWLNNHYFKKQDGKVIGKTTLEDAVHAIDSIAAFSGKSYETFIRIGKLNDKIYYDLGDAAWRVVEIGAEGWHILDDEKSPVKFIRTPKYLSQVEPIREGSIDELRQFINVQNEDNWKLLIGVILWMLHPALYPYFILALYGGSGAAKSTVTKMIKSIVDPSASTARIAPKNKDDLITAALNCHVLDFDNLSHITDEISDALCSIITGGTLSKRAHHENDTEHAISVKRPVIINGIEELATRPDLVERTITIYLKSLDDNTRKEEAELWQKFNEAKPGILGAFFDAMSAALKNRSSVKLESAPRMIDATKFITAAEPVLKGERTFLELYTEHQNEQRRVNIESSHVGRGIMELLNNEASGLWTGSAMDLIEELKRLGVADSSKNFPTTPRGMRSQLVRLEASLKVEQIALELPEKATRNKTTGTVERSITITDTKKHKEYQEQHPEGENLDDVSYDGDQQEQKVVNIASKRRKKSISNKQTTVNTRRS